MAYYQYIKPSIVSKFTDILLMTSLRHIAKKIVFGFDHYFTFISKNLEATSTRCTACYRLCRFNFDSVLTSCGHCRRSS